MATSQLPLPLTGRFLVRVIRPALHDAHRILPKKRDRAILRRHALKLRFWPAPLEQEAGWVLDINWSWIKSLRSKQIGELRIDDRIGDCDNLRLAFYVPKFQSEIPMIWIFAAIQKKRDDFSKANIDTFEARRTIVNERFYGF